MQTDKITLNEASPDIIDRTADVGRFFFFYKLPDSDVINYSEDCIALPGFHDNGFVISGFLGQSVLTLVPVRKDSGIEQRNFCFSDSGECEQCSALFPSTTKSEHRKGVLNIIKALNDEGQGKCVLSRRITGKLTRSTGEIFLDLARKYRQAFVFIYNSPLTGLWTGASPELLLKSEMGWLHSMSLAGTRKAASRGEWDAKNIEEQEIVTRFIRDVFSHNDIEPEIGDLHTREAGPVEHLCRNIRGRLESLETAPIVRLLNELSPTPALCGYPRQLAMKLINRNEAHNRECYSGFIGPFIDAHDFSFYVNLRSARLFPNLGVYAQWVGGGITRFSDPDSEWKETELKASTLRL